MYSGKKVPDKEKRPLQWQRPLKMYFSDQKSFAVMGLDLKPGSDRSRSRYQ